MNRSIEAIGLALALFVFTAGEGVVLYFMANPLLRVAIGLLLVAAIILAASRLGVMGHFLKVVSPTIQARRRTRMRTLVGQLLEEVRRLSATAEDGRRGVRGPEKTVELMDSLETTLRGLIERICDVAGDESTRPRDEVEEAHPSGDRP